MGHIALPVLADLWLSEGFGTQSLGWLLQLCSGVWMPRPDQCSPVLPKDAKGAGKRGLNSLIDQFYFSFAIDVLFTSLSSLYEAICSHMMF